jgi:hypothetical protein
VSRDHGWDKASEYKSRPKLRFEDPFFRLKIGRFKATVHRGSASIDVKSGLSDPADFATTRIPIRIVSVTYRGTNFANCSCSHDQSPKYQVHGSVFTANSRKSRQTASHSAKLADRGKTVSDCHSLRKEVLKSVLWIWIRIRIDPDLFCQIRIFERAMIVLGESFSLGVQLESES